MDFSFLKLEIFIPETHLAHLQKALQMADAGHIGNYDCCMSVSEVKGYWRPLAGTHPYIGSQGAISSEPELKVEVTIRTEQLNDVMHAVKAAHPYEEPVINVIPLLETGI
ncbi:MAG: cytochrome C biogenesis protein [Eubacteriales bacterium]|nr:cytochrome C biogenesis protein [Eubacteriales bacterium]